MKKSYIKPNSIFVSINSDGICGDPINMVGSGSGTTTDIETDEGAASEFHRNIWDDDNDGFE